MLWSAKEAIYKYYGQGIDFSQDLIASPFSQDHQKIQLECKFSKNKSTTFIVDFIFHNRYVLSLATKKNDDDQL
jgi:phosphopantetheinyl transferase